MADTIKNIKIKYSSTGLPEQTTQVQRYDRALKSLTTTTYRGAFGANINQMKKVSEATKNGVTQTSKLGVALNSTMMRFIGLNAAISMGSQAYQELRKFIDDSVGSFRSFEYKMAEVSSILDSTTRDTLPSLEVGITQLSVKFGKSVEDMTKGLYDIVSAAFDVDDAIGLLEVATKAAIAGVTSTESAVKTLTGVLNAYGMSAANAAKVSDDLFQAVIRGVFTFSDLEGAMGYVTPIAANLGVSLDEVLSAMSAATRQGQHLDSVTRGLGLLLQGIVDPTTQASDAAKKYGIDMSATALRTYGLTGFLKQLSMATEKYGMQILPQLIGNMRSLRVAIALTGDTGLKGFTDDMELMATSTNRTDDAMAAMMNTQQMMANILTQSMQKLERGVGEAWSGVDIWWKKSQLWWGTLFTGGDADAAIKGLDEQFYQIRQSYLDNLVTPAKKNEKTVLDKLTSGVGVNKAIPWESLTRFTKNAGEMEDYSRKTYEARNALVALEQVRADAANNKGRSTFGGGIYETPEDRVGIIQKNKNLDVLNGLLTKLGINNVTTSTTETELNEIMNKLNGTMDISTQMLTNLNAAQSALRPKVDQVTAAFENMKSQIDNTELSIVMIKSEISDLNEQLNTPYKGFTNILEYGVAVKKSTNQIERFAEYSQMAMSQGPEYLNEFTNQFDQYGNSMNDVLTTIYEYNDAMEEQKKITKETEKANNDLAIAMAFNNLQMLKYELAGMMRRRGNTRAELRAMKNLQIENTKLRIQELQNQYDADVANNDAINSEKQTAYDEAQDILSKYTQFEQHQLWLLQDTRDEDLASLNQNIIDQTLLLKNKEQAYIDSYNTLNEQQSLYQTSLMTVAADPALAKAYRDFFGITAMETAMTTHTAYKAFISGNPAPVGTTATMTAPAPPYVGGAAQAVLNKMPNLNPRLKAALMKGVGGYEGGTDYVPSTGLYQLHKGESVVPAGKNSGGSPIIININNPTVSNPNDIAKLSQALENVVRANLTDKQTGKTKYRMA